MSVTVVRHEMSMSLVPGVSGREDVFAERRELLVGRLRAVLPGSERGADPAGTAAPAVVVVAPGRADRWTERPAPDLGAIGVGDAGGQSAQTLRGDLVHVAASAAVVLVSLAGWDGPLSVCELGPAGAPGALGPTAEDPEETAVTEDVDEGVSAVVSRLVSGYAGDLLVLVACAGEGGVLPAGASASFASAERRVHEVHAALADLVDAHTLSQQAP